jgi:type IV pilus assembly protein PilV
MIGVAALQVAQLYQVNQTNINYIVSQQFMDITDRIRANPVGADSGAYNAITATSAPISNDCSSNCSPTELATFDAIQWNQNNADLLPNGRGTVDSSDGENFRITLMWDEKEDAESETINVSLFL